MSRRFLRSALACALALSSLCLSRAAQASSFDVSPINLVLSNKMTTTMLTVSNRGQEVLRFQITAFLWKQTPEGEMQLEPTQDIVFFPAMLTVNGNESRKLRVGMNVKPEAKERNYRIFVQELPALVRGPDDANSVQVLTKMGIPVFIRPDTPKATVALSDLAVQGGKLLFTVKNTGNVHVRPEVIAVRVNDASSKTVHSQEITGWYVLAGDVRKYVVELPKEACSALRSVDLELRMDRGGAQAALADARCTP